MELVLSHHESRCVHYRYSYLIVERRTIPLWPKKIPAGWTCLKKISYADSTEWIESELIALPLEAMGFGLQCEQCWFEFHSCKGHCPSQSSKTCSVSPGERMYLLSVFFTWLAGERTTISLWHNKDRPSGLISKRRTKCRSNFTECIERAFADLFQGFMYCKNR